MMTPWDVKTETLYNPKLSFIDYVMPGIVGLILQLTYGDFNCEHSHARTRSRNVISVAGHSTSPVGDRHRESVTLPCHFDVFDRQHDRCRQLAFWRQIRRAATTLADLLLVFIIFARTRFTDFRVFAYSEPGNSAFNFLPSAGHAVVRRVCSIEPTAETGPHVL